MKRRALIALVLLLLLILLFVGILYASIPSRSNPTPTVTPTRALPTVTPTHPATPIVTPEIGNG